METMDKGGYSSRLLVIYFKILISFCHTPSKALEQNNKKNGFVPGDFLTSGAYRFKGLYLGMLGNLA